MQPLSAILLYREPGGDTSFRRAPLESQKPVLSLNLESSILGSYCFTKHRGKDHSNLGSTSETLTYDDFKRWAMERARAELN